MSPTPLLEILPSTCLLSIETKIVRPKVESAFLVRSLSFRAKSRMEPETRDIDGKTELREREVSEYPAHRVRLQNVLEIQLRCSKPHIRG
jgi:hypothetical protein